MYKKIKKYLARDVYPFHMPGHKRNPAFLPQNLLELDMTEIPGLDVLSSPTGIIYDLQNKIASFYGANRSFFLVNGSSAGVIAAICATCNNSDTLVVPRNAHTSVYNGMVLSGAEPLYIMPEITPDGLVGGVCPHTLHDIPYGATVLVVSPTYEGFVSNIAAIANVVHSRGGILIVDEAHGAHFSFDSSFPLSAIKNGADIVVQSLHKTLPAPSQTALLHINGNRVDIGRVQFYVNALQTTSPSYMLMSACDYMLRKLWDDPNYFANYITLLNNIYTVLPGEGSNVALRLSGVQRIGMQAIFAIDFGKLLFTVHTATHGEEIAKIMAEEYKVQMEMAADRHILAMTSVADTAEGFERLNAAVNGINEKYAATSDSYTPYWVYPSQIALNADVYHNNASHPKNCITPRDAINSPSIIVPWEEAAGKISAELIAKYPPGVAIIAPGERIAHNLPKLQKTVRVVY